MFALLSPRVLSTEVKAGIVQVNMTLTLVHLYSGRDSFKSYCGLRHVFSDRQVDDVCVCVCVLFLLSRLFPVQYPLTF